MGACLCGNPECGERQERARSERTVPRVFADGRHRLSCECWRCLRENVERRDHYRDDDPAEHST